MELPLEDIKPRIYKQRGLALIVLLLYMIKATSSQITPPPQINDSPIIANNRIYYLKHIPVRCQPPIIDRFSGGGLIIDPRALVKKDNPHIIRGNIQIAPSGCLYIEPGTVLKFAPGMGIIVNGTLIARGSELPGGRITMTKADGEDLGKPSGDWQDDARLVMGNTTRDGRLDLKYQGKWRAICTNYNNFTAIDANVTCRHLGFLKGNFTYHSFSRNLTDYILWEKPDCKGSENSLFDCPGASTIKTGRHICDAQEVIGFECEGLRPGLALDHWRGIDFYNSSAEARYQIYNNTRVYMNESLSFIEYADISYTGLDIFHGRTPEPDIFYQKAAISASPYVPMINNITVKYGAYDALNLTEVRGPIHVANSTLSHNRGYGMFIQSQVGRTLINMTEVNHNWGDGIKFYISNLTIFDFRLKFPPQQSMFNQATITGVAYPFYQHLDLVEVNGNTRTLVTVPSYCVKTYSTSPGMKIGVHFMIMERDPDATGELIFYDGGERGPVINTIPIENGSFPQSITTKSNVLYVKFTYKQPANLICTKLPSCIRFLLEFTSNYDVEEEFRLIMSNVHDNIGYGVNIQDIRSRIRISNETVISFNQFGAGVHVYKGAGDIIINGTRIEGNADAGVNITYSGGYQLINNTQLIGNKGYGIITEYIKLNRTRIEARNRVEIVRATFLWNERIGLRMGNYCRGGNILVNESYFAYNYDEAIEYLSCNISTMFKTNLRIEFNTFNNNFRHGILMRPLLNTEGIITNNTFANHSLSTIRIDNGYDLLISRWYRDFPVTFNIFENTFRENMGRYVINLRLTQNSAVQNIFCKFNFFMRNEINDSFTFLKPRSRANAVIVVSSSNVQFRRNYIKNPLSIREVATHLVDPSVKIDATENYWGTEINAQKDYEQIYNAIFDQDDRYNLAQVQFHPALKTVRLYENILATDVPEYVWQFNRGNLIGGVLESTTFVLGQDKTYYVDKDIYIFPDKTLVMDPNSKLKFAPSVGMVVHGILKADGIKRETPVIFDLDDREEFVPMENRTASVRLVDGLDEFEGRLEVEIDGKWGTVCKDGWIEENSILVCQQLGLTFNREYPTARLQTLAFTDTPVLMSYVSCDDVDVDFTKCRAINSDASTCSHDKDVYLRCFPPTWAGITLAAAYRFDQSQPIHSETQIRFAQINNAGLLDPDIAEVTPALRIDYNYYQVSWLTVNNSMSDGIHVSYCHPYTDNRMEYITVLKSGGNGLLTRSPRLEVMHSHFEDNLKAGFIYNPFFTEYEALLVRNTIYSTRRIDLFAQPQKTITATDNRFLFLICSVGQAIEQREYLVELKATSSTFKLALQILDYLPVESAEKVTVFDSGKADIASSNIKRWEIEKDLVDFPILSSSSVLTIQLLLNGQLSGRLAFTVIARNYGSLIPQLRTAVTNTSFIHNDQGIVTKHYNSPSNRRLELFHRHKVEEIYFKDLKILNSVRHAIHMPSVTKFTEDYIPTYEDMTVPERVAKIMYTILTTFFKDNAIGILAEHNHVDFANNVWQWKVDHIIMNGTQKGGLEIEVPRVNDETEREYHAVYVFDSYFQNCQNFAFTVAGYYADVKVDRNGFINNRCLLGLVSIKGMEKNLTFNTNIITNNVCRYMVDIDIQSHSEYYTTVLGQVNLNEITDNHYEGIEPPGSPYSPKTYALAVKGLVNVTSNMNILKNPTLGYELVAGITCLTLGNPVDFTLNYWGVTDQPSIRKRIFDFDDWNNYAIAEYFPYLTRPDRNSPPSTGIRDEILLDPSYLGGRVEKSQILVEIGRPYIVQSDLTIMPGITLTIPAGTELQFRPNVGILVLGRLIANGLPYSRIKLKPLEPSNDPIVGRRKREEMMASERHKRDSASANIRLRGDGALFKNAGFLELYNASSKTWNMMCDSQFNEKTAEVVCRELGKEVINVKVRFTHLYDYYIYGKPQYFRKEFWYNQYHCRGDETYLSQCITRYNFNLLSCIYAANYTFISCGDRNLEPGREYWGNIRFAYDSYAEKPLEADIGVDRSIIRYMDIEGAGMLHGEKVGAIQTTYVTPIFENINITKCAENGYDIIAPRQKLDLIYQNISGNLGYGINILVLNGESSDRRSSFLPNSLSTIPYFVHGLVDICRLEKEIFLETRLILYYKYGPYMKDCVKIISSSKTIGLRFLQINLFKEDFSRNVVEIFDGKEVSSQTLIAKILANSSAEEIQSIYKSTGTTMSVHVHASISQGIYGFVAEVVRLPLSGLTYPNSDFSHTIDQAEICKNEDGAIQYKNVGETNPNVYIEHCWISENGFRILNLTSPPTIDISLQSTISFRFSHNQVAYNIGGMYLFAHTSLITTALRGNMTNNVFAFGTNGEALNISGHYFERLMLFQNYFYNYTAGDYRDVIHIKNVVVNLTHNYILNNFGHYILHTYNNDDSTNPQIFVRNGIYGNNATALREATIKVGEGSPKFTNNYLVNNLNDFEIEAPPQQLASRNIDAKNNWWGSERQAYIEGKTLDSQDDQRLATVDVWPPILDNRSMVEGDCLAGWVYDKNRCYRYMGGAAPFEQAKEFCKSHGAFLAEAKDREGFFNYLIRLMVIEPDWTQRVWIMAEVGSGRCAAFERNYIVYEQECGRRYYPFICETDPGVTAPVELTAAVQAMIIGICVGVGGIIIIIVLVIIILWCIKSKRREKERFERTASIRSSLNNLTKINTSLRGTKSTLTVLSEGASRRRLNELDDDRSVVSSTAKYSQGSAMSSEVDGSVHSMNSSYEVNHKPKPEPAPPRREQTAKPVHSLRPDRSGKAGRMNENATRAKEREDQERKRDRRRRGEERQQNYESSDDGSVDKEDFDSTFDEEEDEENHDVNIDVKNMQYHVNRSNERLFQKPVIPSRPLLSAASGDSDQSDFQDNSDKSKSVSSFTDPIDPPAKNTVLSQRTASNHIPTPPPLPKFAQASPHTNKPSPKPVPRPKPLPPSRTNKPPADPGHRQWTPSEMSYNSSQQSSAVPDSVPMQKITGSQNNLYNNDQNQKAPLYNPVNDVRPKDSVPRQKFSGNQDHLYNNDQASNTPLYDPVYGARPKDRSHLYKNLDNSSDQSSRGPVYDPVYDGQSHKGSQGVPHYDPVYSGKSSDHTNSTSDRYEPVNYGPPYGIDQVPDTDYMPRPPGNPSLGHSREFPEASSPASSASRFRGHLESDTLPSDVDYMPRQLHSSGQSTFDDSLPPKPGVSDRSYPSITSQDSIDNIPAMPRPPPYTSIPLAAASRSYSSNRLDHSRGSRDHLHEAPPPYSPGEELMPRRHGGSNDVLYFNQGTQRNYDSIETDI